MLPQGHSRWKANSGQAWCTSSAAKAAAMRRGPGLPGVLELKVPAGTHVEISPDLEGIQTQWLRGVEITGSAVEKTITIGALGLLRVRLIADGKPLNKARIEVYDDYDDYVMDLARVAGGTFEARLPGGMYRIFVEPDSDSYDVEFIDDIELEDGQTESSV